MDIEVQCDTTGSMGGEVDTAMEVLPDMYSWVAKVLHGYDPQLCIGIFGDCVDPFVLCRPQFEMLADRIVNYLTEMAPQRKGGANGGEDPQYAMFARAYLTSAYTNRIGLKGYHFVVTDEPCHQSIERYQVTRIFGEKIFENELKSMRGELPSINQVVTDLKKKTHAFVLIPTQHTWDSGFVIDSWRQLYGRNSVILIDTTRDLPQVIASIIGLTEGVLDIMGIDQFTEGRLAKETIDGLSQINLQAQLRLRHALPHPLPKRGDIFASKDDLWPIGHCSDDVADPKKQAANKITYF